MAENTKIKKKKIKKGKINNKKRVVYFTMLKLPTKMANSVHIMKMCQALQREGLEVTLIANFKGKEEDVFAYYGIKDKFKIKSLMMPSIRVLGWVICIFAAIRYLYKEKPELIYVRDHFSSVLFNILNIPIIYEFHEDPNDLFKIRKYFHHKSLIRKNVKLIVLISHNLKRITLKKYGKFINNKKLIVAHDGADILSEGFKNDKAILREQLGLPQDKYLIGYTGSFFKGRGIDVIVEIAECLKDYQFVLAGGYKKELIFLQKTIKNRGIKNIKLLGYIPHSLISFYISAFDILLMPYQYKVTVEHNKRDISEVISPLKMFEYMASGNPIISSNLPVIREVLQDRENALIVTPDKVNEWCSAIELLNNDPKLAEKISKKAKKDVAKYSWEKRANGILSYIE
jgi:glycosyltransferase involved in cell wall biosynthesis